GSACKGRFADMREGGPCGLKNGLSGAIVKHMGVSTVSAQCRRCAKSWHHQVRIPLRVACTPRLSAASRSPAPSEDPAAFPSRRLPEPERSNCGVCCLCRWAKRNRRVGYDDCKSPC